jgi:hypothetical protein
VRRFVFFFHRRVPTYSRWAIFRWWFGSTRSGVKSTDFRMQQGRSCQSSGGVISGSWLRMATSTVAGRA